MKKNHILFVLSQFRGTFGKDDGKNTENNKELKLGDTNCFK